MQNHYHRCRIIFPSPFRQSCIPLACLIAAAHKGAPSLNQRQWPLDLSPERSQLIWNVVVCMTLPQSRSLSSVLSVAVWVSLCLSSPGAITLDAEGSPGVLFSGNPGKEAQDCGSAFSVRLVPRLAAVCLLLEGLPKHYLFDMSSRFLKAEKPLLIFPSWLENPL